MPTYSETMTLSRINRERNRHDGKPDTSDQIWTRLRQDVFITAKSEPMLAGYLHDSVLKHGSLEASLSYLLAGKLSSSYLTTTSLRDVLYEAMTSSEEIRRALRRDLSAVVERDPAAKSLALPYLNFKGFQALQSYRAAHWLWRQERHALALHLQSRISEAFDVDIHPAARIGTGILIDHGTSVVIGETAVVEDDVSMLHEVTLGGTGKEAGDRHPKVGKGVLIGAGAKILGNIKIGAGSKIAAGSVVLNEVPPNCTVAGIPARVVGKPGGPQPSKLMDQYVEFDYSI
ncbi:serine O-acetyltransferase [Geobacter sp. SVR]|nr:serine O-acetyltransferase [Geobacter sp. SVR]GCF87689.1 serine O-acetyltransferase [Geobacter sp. SVR]